MRRQASTERGTSGGRYGPAGRTAILLVLLLLMTIITGAAAESPLGTGFSRNPAVIETAAASAVRLEVFDKDGNGIGTGSGFAAFEPAVLVTAAHVIVNMDYMIATKDDGTTFRIDRAYDADTDADVAICELPEDANITPLQWSKEAPARGEPATAIGSQFGLINLVTMGNVCGRWEAGGVNWILFTAPVSGGSSGGPLLNDEGNVMGVITGTYDKAQNLNLAAPYEAAAKLYGTDNDEGGTSK